MLLPIADASVFANAFFRRHAQHIDQEKMSTFVSPMQPVAPPAKKIKADLDNVEAVRKRRDELNKLKQKQLMRTAEKTTPGGTKVRMTSSQGLLAQARSQLDGQQPPGARPPAPPVPPGAVPLDRVRHSDIFPTVGKVAARVTEPPRAGNLPPPPGAHPGYASPSRRQHQAVEPVVRRLDQSFGQGKSPAPPPASRSRSAPPVRPPPPPGPPPLTKEAPEATPSRSFASRPPPVTPGANPKAAPGELKIPPMASSKETPPPPVSTPNGLPPPAVSPMIPPPVSSQPQIVPEKTATQPSPPVTSGIHQNVKPSSLDLSQSAPGQTMPPTQEPPTAVPQKPRQDLIRNLHQFADSPNAPAKAKTEIPKPSAHGSSMLRLEKQVMEHEKEKAEALRRVAILEEQLQKLKEKGDPEEELGALVQMAEKEGDDAALQWARGRVAGTTPRPSASKV